MPAMDTYAKHCDETTDGWNSWTYDLAPGGFIISFVSKLPIRLQIKNSTECRLAGSSVNSTNTAVL
jgi:hypothetical protein